MSAEAPAVRAYSPRTLAEALEVLSLDPEVKPVAGCTDLLVTTPEGRLAWPSVMSVVGIPELHTLVRDTDGWRIGAAVTFSRIRSESGLRETFPILAEAASVVGGWQIQNRATVGGNVVNASPAGDSLPVLLALGATAIAVGPKGEREIPYDRFHTGYRKTALRPGEILGGSGYPTPPPPACSSSGRSGPARPRPSARWCWRSSRRIARGCWRGCGSERGAWPPPRSG